KECARHPDAREDPERRGQRPPSAARRRGGERQQRHEGQREEARADPPSIARRRDEDRREGQRQRPEQAGHGIRDLPEGMRFVMSTDEGEDETQVPRRVPELLDERRRPEDGEDAGRPRGSASRNASARLARAFPEEERRAEERHDRRACSQVRLDEERSDEGYTRHPRPAAGGEARGEEHEEKERKDDRMRAPCMAHETRPDLSEEKCERSRRQERQPRASQPPRDEGRDKNPERVPRQRGRIDRRVPASGQGVDGRHEGELHRPGVIPAETRVRAQELLAVRRAARRDLEKRVVVVDAHRGPRMRREVRPRGKQRQECEEQAQPEDGAARQEAAAFGAPLLAPEKLAQGSRAGQFALRELAEVESLAGDVRGPVEEPLVREADEAAVVEGGSLFEHLCRERGLARRRFSREKREARGLCGRRSRVLSTREQLPDEQPMSVGMVLDERQMMTERPLVGLEAQNGLEAEGDGVQGRTSLAPGGYCPHQFEEIPRPWRFFETHEDLTRREPGDLGHERAIEIQKAAGSRDGVEERSPILESLLEDLDMERAPRVVERI